MIIRVSGVQILPQSLLKFFISVSRIEPSCTLLAISEWITEALSSIGFKDADGFSNTASQRYYFVYRVDLLTTIDITIYSDDAVILLQLLEPYLELEFGDTKRIYHYDSLDPHQLAKYIKDQLTACYLQNQL